ncbi:MAG TPA: amino acid racemase [Rubricoccaceae bacterium]|jgi:aspartate racemase
MAEIRTTPDRSSGQNAPTAPLLGILGGMGPLASAEFVRTLYECNLANREQDMPRCVLYSDPTIPDRTEAIRQGTPGPVVDRLEQALSDLARLGVDRIVVPCVTAHHFLPQVRPDLRALVVSLVDLALDAVVSAGVPHLLFCTDGTRQAGIFQSSPRWPDAEPLVVLPGDEDQHAVHELLYKVKQGDVGEDRIADVERLMGAYAVDGLIAGCTEMHLLTKKLASRGGDYHIADPLLTVAQDLPAVISRGGLEQVGGEP